MSSVSFSVLHTTQYERRHCHVNAPMTAPNLSLFQPIKDQQSELTKRSAKRSTIFHRIQPSKSIKNMQSMELRRSRHYRRSNLRPSFPSGSKEWRRPGCLMSSRWNPLHQEAIKPFEFLPILYAMSTARLVAPSSPDYYFFTLQVKSFPFIPVPTLASTHQNGTVQHRCLAYLGKSHILEIVDAASYQLPSSNELLIRNHAVAINPVDWAMQIMGNGLIPWLKYPHIFCYMHLLRSILLIFSTSLVLGLDLCGI